MSDRIGMTSYASSKVCEGKEKDHTVLLKVIPKVRGRASKRRRREKKAAKPQESYKNLEGKNNGEKTGPVDSVSRDATRKRKEIEVFDPSEFRTPKKRKKKECTKEIVKDFPRKHLCTKSYGGVGIRFFKYRDTFWNPAKEIWEALGGGEKGASINIMRAGIEDPKYIIQGSVDNGRNYIDMNVFSVEGVKKFAEYMKKESFLDWHGKRVEEVEEKEEEKKKKRKETASKKVKEIKAKAEKKTEKKGIPATGMVETEATQVFAGGIAEKIKMAPRVRAAPGFGSASWNPKVLTAKPRRAAEEAEIEDL